MPLASGEKVYLKVVQQTQQVIIGGNTVEETVDIGSVVHARPGPAVDGPEFIMLVTEEGHFRWDAAVGDYDPDTVDDEPANEARWVAI